MNQPLWRADFYIAFADGTHLEIRPLSPELAADYFDFFENRAFTDNSPYRCYCQMYQMSKEQVKAAYDNADGLDVGQMSRKVAEQQIESGILRGYLAFVDDVAIGWCNANDKANFPVESCTGTRFYAPAEKREKAVVCFEIAPEYRGKGVAAALLQRVIDDAGAEGYTAIEGFPVMREERYEWDCTGPVRLYEKLGFVKAAVQEKNVVMRKELL
jgi:GNAT superfamily N-acetyltransferase